MGRIFNALAPSLGYSQLLALQSRVLRSRLRMDATLEKSLENITS